MLPRAEGPHPAAPVAGRPVPDRARARRVARVVASVATTVGLLVAVAARVDLRAVLAELSSLHLGFLLGAAALGPLQIALSAERWRVISGALDRPLDRGLAVREYGLSMLLNQLLPGGVAGDAIRAWRAAHGGLFGSVRAVVVDRLVGLAVHLVVVAVGLAAWTRVHPVPAPPGAGPIAALLLAGMVAVALAPDRLWGVGALGADLRVVLRSTAPAVLGLSAALTATFLLGFAACGEAVGHSLGWASLTAVPLVLLSMAVPIGFGGWGLREATAALLLPRLGVPPESAVAISAAYGLSAMLGALPGALGPLWAR